LHYNRLYEPVANRDAAFSVYNSKTRGLFTFMGKAGEYSAVSQRHEINLWPLLESVLGLVDQGRKVNEVLPFDYTDWAQKKDASIDTILLASCRESLQWLACWLGKRYDASQLALQYTALATMSDDVCIPPLDLVHGKFRMFQMSAYDMIQQMQTNGWGRDATHVLLSLVLQYILQYAEKVEIHQKEDPRSRLHGVLSQSSTVWDSTVYRARTADTLGVLICLARIEDTGTLPDSWFFEAGICNCIAMDLGKMTTRVYKHDMTRPTKTIVTNDRSEKQEESEMSRRAKYHSLYLDLMDRLLDSGAPDIVPRFGSAGFLFAYMVDRYRERQAGRRIPISPLVEKQVAQLWGGKASDPWTEGLFRLRALASASLSVDCDDEDRIQYAVSLPPEVIRACRDRQQERVNLFKEVTTSNASCSTASTISTQVQDIAACSGLTKRIHALAPDATGPSHLQSLLHSLEGLRYSPASSTASNEDIWALCLGCQTGCSQNCEWLAFSEYLAKEVR
jgi:hypothetical protein